MNIVVWMKAYCRKVRECFGNRVFFIGLQGSYARGEAGPKSDIDTVLILDSVGAAEVHAYRALLDDMPFREYTCGFFSDRTTLERWEKSDLLQLCLDTVPWYGSLEPLMDGITRTDAVRAVHIGACNLYHGCVHSMLHGDGTAHIPGLYKSAQFVLRMVYYLQHGRMPASTGALMESLSPEHLRIMEDRKSLWAGVMPDTADALGLRLMTLAQELIAQYGRDGR